MIDQVYKQAESAVRQAVDSFVQLDTLVAFAVALLLAYLFSKLLTALIVRIARVITNFGENSKLERIVHMRRLETYLSVSLALMRAAVYGIAIFAAWQFTNPETTPLAIVGASTVFIVLAGATITPTLRDITAGGVMIVERWYNVGDHVTLEPFVNVSGVVERMTLRSTKIRSLNGEVIWVHNQYIQGAKITPKGVRTMAIDLFVKDLRGGKSVIEHVAKTLPVGPTMLAQPLTIVDSQKLGEKLWHITAVCQTAPGREWLIEDFAVEALKEQNKALAKSVISHGPIVRYADVDAERRFKRAVRIKQVQDDQAV